MILFFKCFKTFTQFLSRIMLLYSVTLLVICVGVDAARESWPNLLLCSEQESLIPAHTEAAPAAVTGASS